MRKTSVSSPLLILSLLAAIPVLAQAEHGQDFAGQMANRYRHFEQKTRVQGSLFCRGTINPSVQTCSQLGLREASTGQEYGLIGSESRTQELYRAGQKQVSAEVKPGANGNLQVIEVQAL